MTATAVVAERPPRATVGWRDLIGVTWRQHRLMLVGTGVLVLAAIAAMLWVSANVEKDADLIGLPGLRQISDLGELLLAGVLGFSGLIAVFWAAPLLSKEYEQRTHLLVWSQDVSPLRWLAVKTTVLAVVAVAFSVALGVTASFMMHRILEAPAQYPPVFSLFRSPYFDDVALTQAAYALFGFALGLAVSAICRRTVTSMGVTLALFVGVRAVVERFVRPYFQTPVRETNPIGVDGPATSVMQPNSLSVASGNLDAAGNPIDFPRVCNTGSSVHTAQDYHACLRQNGVVSNYRDFQPADRLGFFQFAEFGVFVVLAAVLLLVGLRVVRRMSRV
ncbi:hypothetical protein [Amycolatopsis minnesotensis]|uniref:ABC transporter permease n=1 Tax=Amycolatopsis minnesotensis TaxID=337894 RepID=A0ABN2QTV4_9PSEU